MKKFLFLFLIAGIVACSTVKTTVDYDSQADFAKYKTYSLLEDNLTEMVGQLNRNRIISALESELANKGFSKADEPDILVDVHIKSEQKVEATATTTGGGYGRWGGYGGYSTTQVNYDEYTVGSMFITMIDNASQNVVWQGVGNKTVDENASPEKRDENITYAIQQILANYPPAQK